MAARQCGRENVKLCSGLLLSLLCFIDYWAEAYDLHLLCKQAVDIVIFWHSRYTHLFTKAEVISLA